MDIGFQGQKGEWLFLITIVYRDITGKKQRATSMVGGSQKKRWQAGLQKYTPRFYLRQGLYEELGLVSAESKKNLLASKP